MSTPLTSALSWGYADRALLLPILQVPSLALSASEPAEPAVRSAAAFSS
jgi:hypothetical protein